MKRDIVLIIFSFLLVNAVSSQPPAQFAEGIIVKKTRDSLKCFVELSQGYAAEVKYKLEANGNLKTIPVKQVQNLITPYQYYENIPVDKEEKLMVLAVRGPVKLYRYINFTSGAVEAVPGILIHYEKSDVDCVIKKGGSFFTINEKNFKKSIPDILGDCDKLKQSIKKNEYNFEHIDKIVTAYNNCHKSESEIASEKKLIGKWKSDLSDETTRENIGEVIMTYTLDGMILYDIIEGKNIQRMTLSYRTAGDSIFSFQSPQPGEQVTKYKFDGDNKLILEINGTKSVFVRL